MITPSPHHPTARDLTLRMFDIMNEGAYERLPEVLDENAVIEWPQSRERLHGYTGLQHIMQAYPGGTIQPHSEEAEFAEGDEATFLLTPMFTVVRTELSGDSATSAIKTRYPDGSDWYIVTIAKARDGKLIHLTEYFAPFYDAPEWRANWVERMDEGR